MTHDEFTREKALGCGLAAAAVTLVLLAPVFCTTTSGASGVLTGAAYLLVRKTRNNDGA